MNDKKRKLYWGDKERIRINTEIRKKNENITLHYMDNGKGISDQDLPKIFEPFFTSNKKIGTGLGLFMTYNIVTQLLKGQIGCISKEGDGVKLTISIPAYIKEES